VCRYGICWTSEASFTRYFSLCNKNVVCSDYAAVDVSGSALNHAVNGRKAARNVRAAFRADSVRRVDPSGMQPFIGPGANLEINNVWCGDLVKNEVEDDQYDQRNAEKPAEKIRHDVSSCCVES
jgi:hypothetical protein